MRRFLRLTNTCLFHTHRNLYSYISKRGNISLNFTLRKFFTTIFKSLVGNLKRWVRLRSSLRFFTHLSSETLRNRLTYCEFRYRKTWLIPRTCRSRRNSKNRRFRKLRNLNRSLRKLKRFLIDEGFLRFLCCRKFPERKLFN